MERRTKKIVLWISAAVIIIIIILMLYRNREEFKSVSVPFFTGTVIAYLLNPAVAFLERRGFRRVVAAATVYILILAVFAGIASYLLPSAYREMARLTEILPFYTFKIKSYLDTLYIRFSKSLTPEIREAVRNNIDVIQTYTTKKITEVTSTLIKVFESIINWVVAFIISFYLVKDKDYFINIFKYMVPLRRRQEVLKLGSRINTALTRFIRGQLVVALLVGILSALGFLLIDLNFALLMGLVTGIANVIPYFGPIIGGVPVVILGLLDSPGKALWAVLVVFVVQQVESGIITPKIVGDSVGIHPVFIILSLFIAAKFFGIVGMLFAVPVAAIIKILACYLFEKIYHGDGPSDI